jgi:hypothetical protein
LVLFGYDLHRMFFAILAIIFPICSRR